MADGSCPGEIRQPPAWHADAGRGPSTPSDPERGRVLTNEELICEHAARVGAHWSGRPCLLDPRFLGAALDASEAPAWLPALFDAVDRKPGRAIAPTHAALEVLLFGGRSMSCTILRESSLISRRSVSLRFRGRWRDRERSKRRSFQSISGGALEGGNC